MKWWRVRDSSSESALDQIALRDRGAAPGVVDLAKLKAAAELHLLPDEVCLPGLGGELELGGRWHLPRDRHWRQRRDLMLPWIHDPHEVGHLPGLTRDLAIERDQ